MVWHALLLSPTQYQNFCKASRREDMLKLQFPWLLIVGRLNYVHGLENYG